MAIMKKQKKTPEENLQAKIEKELDDSFEFAVGDDGVLWNFVQEFEEQFEVVPAYLPLLHAAVLCMQEAGMSQMDVIRSVADIVELYSEDNDE